MTKKKILLFVLLFSITSVLITCKKKGCTDSKATNYCSKCKSDAASCVYDASIQDYVGTWNVAASCGATAYSMTISASGSTLTFTKLRSCFVVTGSVSGGTLTIPSQSLTMSTSCAGLPMTVSGSGTLSGSGGNFNSLQLTYTTKDNSGNPISCSCTCTK